MFWRPRRNSHSSNHGFAGKPIRDALHRRQMVVELAMA
jgi:hypothetical protein